MEVTMRRFAFRVVIASFLALGGPASLAAAAPDPGGKAKGLEKENQHQRQQEFLDVNSDRHGNPRPGLWRKGIDDFLNLPISSTWHEGQVKAKLLNQPQAAPSASAPSASSLFAAPLAAPAAAPSSPITGVQWTQIGPAPLRIDDKQSGNTRLFQGKGPDSGEVTDIAISPSGGSDRTMYIATNDGGVWKSIDAGSSWTPLTDTQTSLSMGAIAVDPSNTQTVYAGTGNGFDGGRFFTKGVGIYRSTDGGQTWGSQPLGGNLFKNVAINRIVVLSNGTLLVAADNGLYRSVDGGANFGANSPTFDDGNPVRSGRVTDVDVDTANGNTVYASVAGTGNNCPGATGLFRSTNGGVNFTNLFTSTNGGPTAQLCYIAFAQSTQPNNQTMYATTQTASGFGGLFRSTDGGANWNTTAGANTPAAADGGCQCGYDQTVGVDPQNANRVYIGFQRLYRSDNGGTSFGSVTDKQVHWDHHALIFSPPSHVGTSGTTPIYVGTDGGIATSPDAGANWTNINEGIATNLFKHIDIGQGGPPNPGDPPNNAFTYGGTHDTGTEQHRPDYPGNDWHEAFDGDGFAAAVDPDHPTHALATSNGCMIETTDGGNNWSAVPTRIPGGTSNCGAAGSTSTLIREFEFDPADNQNVWAAQGLGNIGAQPGPRLFRSTNNGSSFSQVATAAPANISAIGTTKLDSQTLWVGLDNGTLLRSTNALATTPTFTPVTVTGLAPGRIGGIAVDPTDLNTVVVTYEGFSAVGGSNRTRHVFRTTNNGTSWTDISGTDGGTQNLPDLPTHSVVIDGGTSPHTIIVSNDAGVARSVDRGATWQRLGTGLPTVDSTTLKLDDSVTPPVLRLGTYGRSVFELTSATGPQLSINGDLAFDSVPVGRRATRQVQFFNTGSADLHILSFARSAGSAEFSIISGPTTPVTVHPGDHVDYTVQFAPTSVGDKTATFTVKSDDPNQPSVDLPASGTGVTGEIGVNAGSVDFDGVPVDNRTSPHTANRIVQISNQASCSHCDINVTSLPITGPNASDFTLVDPPALPYKIGAGSHLDLTVRFNPSDRGNRNATLTINSNDPVHPQITVSLAGEGLMPGISTPDANLIFPPTVYDPVCADLCGSKIIEPYTNNGQAELIVDSISFTGSSAFSGPGATSPPSRFAPNSGSREPITFRPTGSAARKLTGTMTILDTLGSGPAVSRQVGLCGESVGRGIRLKAVNPGGTPFDTLRRVKLISHGFHNNVNVNEKNLSLTTLNPPTTCKRIQFQYENQNLPSTERAEQQGAYYALTATTGNQAATITFTLGVNQFKRIVLTIP